MSDQAALNALQVALEANAAAYRRAVQSSAPGDCWDYLILTAADQKQAQGYRQELALRHRAVGPTGAFFPAIQRSFVVADPPGRRIGSGGATLAACQALIEQHKLAAADLERARILLIHSGGASQRLPAYAPLGKIFAPLPLLRPDGQIATLFDHLYLTLAGLPERLGPGLLVLAGDVFLLFDHRHVTPPPAGVTAISMRVEAQRGTDHGVFVADARGRISQTLQKADVPTLKRHGAVDSAGRVLIDTGLLFFDAPRTRLLTRLAGCAMGRRSTARPALHERYSLPLDLYDDMTAALATGTSRTDYLKPPAAAGRRGDAVPAMRRELWRVLHGLPFGVMQMDGQFLHLGTTRQFRDAMVGHNPSPAAELFQQNVLAHSQWPMESGRRVYHGVLLANGSASGSLGAGSVVEHSVLKSPSRVGAGSVVSQVVALRRPIDLGDNLLLFQVPVRQAGGTLAYVQVLCGVEDDFQGSWAGGQCLYLNRPIEQWLARHGIAAGELWAKVPPAQRTLWTARLFVATEDRDSAAGAMWAAGGTKASPGVLRRWRGARRYSMAMMLEQADPAALIEHREVVAAYLQTNDLLKLITRREDKPVESMLGHYSTTAAYAVSESLLRQWAQQPSADAALSLDQARTMWCMGQLLQRPDHPGAPEARRRIDGCMSQAFAKVAQASEIGHRAIAIRVAPPKCAPRTTEVIATAPVRLDLTGGWSDTPPYCFERGGHVINVAIDLDGRPPIRVICRPLRQPVIKLESYDLGQQAEFPVAGNGGNGAIQVDVRDPFALHKVALQMTGFLQASGPHPGGVQVITECRMPKGSGLGTSSILAATLLAALQKLRGLNASIRELIEQTLLLEQRLSTGGGWQDQIGGIVGGVKSTVSAPGIPQRPVVETLALSDAQYHALQERLVVYYSGQQRLARDILRRVEGRWLGREPAAVLLTEELKTSAAALRRALLKGQWSLVAAEIGRYWRLKKELYPGSTTPTIDVLLLELRQHYVSAGLAGAGGGGFAYFFCKDAKQARTLRQVLAERSARPGSLGSVYQTQINRTGLTVLGR